jgi:hypothetical protein
MSIVVAAYNETDIVIGWDSPSTYKDALTGKAIIPPEEVQKVRRINDRLALMITGTYMSDKIPFMKDFATSVKEVVDLDTAFDRLSAMAKETMTVYTGESFGIGLAGFHQGIPGFQIIGRVYGEPVNDQPNYPKDMNCYLQGVEEAYQLVADRLKEKGIFSKPPTPVIEATIQNIVSECIRRYPQQLGEPVQTLVLSKA